MAGGKLGSAAGRAGGRGVPLQWKDREELVRAAVNARAWIAVRRSTERTAADMAMRQKLVVAKEGCCDLSTSVHHLVDKLGTELGYLMSKDTGYDVEDCITLATKGLKLRVARRVWRDYYRHSFARQHCADPSTEGLADQQRRRKISEEDSRRDEQERAKNHEFWAWKARNLSAWAPRGMG